MNHRIFVLFIVLPFLDNVQAQNAARDAQVDAVRNAQADATARADAEHETIGAGLWVLNAGLLAEDLQVIKAFLFAENDPKSALVEAHARRIIACKRFADAAQKVFGAETAAPLGLMDLSAFGMGLLAPTWVIHGDTASPAAEDAAQFARNEIVLPRLVNRRGVWKVDVTPSPMPSPEGIAALATAIENYATIVDDVAKAIAVGRLKTVGEVKEALKPLPQFARPVEYSPDVVLSLPAAAPATTPAGKGK